MGRLIKSLIWIKLTAKKYEIIQEYDEILSKDNSSIHRIVVAVEDYM